MSKCSDETFSIAYRSTRVAAGPYGNDYDKGCTVDTYRRTDQEVHLKKHLKFLSVGVSTEALLFSAHDKHDSLRSVQ